MMPSQTALLLIDFQVDFGSPHGAMAMTGADMTAAEAAIRKAIVLADAARAAGVAPVFVRLLSPPGAEPPLCVKGTLGADFLGPQPVTGERIVSKTRFSAFSGTGLADELRGQGVTTLVLAGLTTECCVASTAWAAFEEGFAVAIAADACAAYSQTLHKATLEALALSGAIVRHSDEFAALWEKSS